MADNEILGQGRIITLMEAAQLLGTSYPTAHRMACAGELKAFRLRSSWRTSTSACREYVERQMAEQERACRARQVQ